MTLIDKDGNVESELKRLSTAPPILWFTVSPDNTTSWFSAREAREVAGDGDLVLFTILTRDQRAKLQAQIDAIMSARR